MRKDSSAHDYTWYLPLEHDIQIAKMRPGAHSLDLIMTGDDPTPFAVPGKASPGQPLPPHRDPSAAIPKRGCGHAREALINEPEGFKER
jgi:hypothetical protein